MHFAQIIVPLVSPAIATVVIMSFQSGWNATEASNLFINNEVLKNFTFYMSNLSSAGGVAGQGGIRCGEPYNVFTESYFIHYLSVKGHEHNVSFRNQIKELCGTW